MPNEFEEKLLKELSSEIRKYKMYVDERIRQNNIYTNYMANSEDKILTLMEMMNIDKHDGVKKVYKKKMSPMSIEQIMKRFNDEDVAKLLVVDIDMQRTLDNIEITLGYSKKIAKEVIDLLLQNEEYQYTELEITK